MLVINVRGLKFWVLLILLVISYLRPVYPFVGTLERRGLSRLLQAATQSSVADHNLRDLLFGDGKQPLGVRLSPNPDTLVAKELCSILVKGGVKFIDATSMEPSQQVCMSVCIHPRVNASICVDFQFH